MRRLLSLRGVGIIKRGLGILFLAEEAAGQTDQYGHARYHRRADDAGHRGENPLAMLETWVQSLGWEDPLEKGKATHSSILTWRIPWTA